VILMVLDILEPPDGSQDAAAKLPQSEKPRRDFMRVLAMQVRLD
jgi:hypothetical protein